MNELEPAVDTTEVSEPPTPVIPLEGRCNLPLAELPSPRYMREGLVYLQGYFIVEMGNAFGYYPIKLHPDKKGAFYRIRNSPPFLVNGIVCIEDAFISVPISDLVRKHVNTTRILSKRATKSRSRAGAEPSSTSDQPGLSEVDEVQVSQAIDLALQEQESALQYLEHSKEVW